MNKQEFKNLLKKPCLQVYEEFKKNGNKLVGFGFNTCEGFPHIGIRGLSQEGETCSEYNLFVTDEWNLEGDFSLFDKANDWLIKNYERGEENEESNPDWYDAYSDIVISSCIETLEELIKNDSNNLFLMMGISDSLMPFNEGVKWSARLNSLDTHEQYKKFSETVMENGYY